MGMLLSVHLKSSCCFHLEVFAPTSGSSWISFSHLPPSIFFRHLRIPLRVWKGGMRGYGRNVAISWAMVQTADEQLYIQHYSYHHRSGNYVCISLKCFFSLSFWRLVPKFLGFSCFQFSRKSIFGWKTALVKELPEDPLDQVQCKQYCTRREPELWFIESFRLVKTSEIIESKC